MKKALLVFITAASLVACNNAADTSGNAKDSLDSIANAKKDMIDSAADTRKDKVDSTTQAMKNSMDTRDSATHAGTGDTAKHK